MRKYTYIAVCALALLPMGCLEAVHDGVMWGKDIGKAEAWKTLALQGDVEAQYKVGETYCCGDRPRYDNVQALYWFCKAGKQNQRDALLEIGKMYEHAHSLPGTVVPRNNTLAYAYYTLAVLNGNDRAVSYYQGMAPKLTEEERKDVAKLLEKFPDIPCEVYR